jgi:hypothetical protein
MMMMENRIKPKTVKPIRCPTIKLTFCLCKVGQQILSNQLFVKCKRQKRKIDRSTVKVNGNQLNTAHIRLTKLICCNLLQIITIFNFFTLVVSIE